MEFNIKSVKVKISFTFLCLFLLIIPTGNYKIFIYSLFSSLLHEFIHILFILIFKGDVSEITLSFFGGNIKRNNNIILACYKEAIISISAPLINILIGLIALVFIKTEIDFSAINIFLGVFNLLPFYSFDGGRALKYSLINKVDSNTIDLILLISSILITGLFSLVSIYIFFNYNRNYFLMLISIFMILSVIFNIKNN